MFRIFFSMGRHISDSPCDLAEIRLKRFRGHLAFLWDWEGVSFMNAVPWSERISCRACDLFFFIIIKEKSVGVNLTAADILRNISGAILWSKYIREINICVDLQYGLRFLDYTLLLLFFWNWRFSIFFVWIFRIDFDFWVIKLFDL